MRAEAATERLRLTENLDKSWRDFCFLTQKTVVLPVAIPELKLWRYIVLHTYASRVKVTICIECVLIDFVKKLLHEVYKTKKPIVLSACTSDFLLYFLLVSMHFNKDKY